MLQKQIYVGESSFESMVEENAYLVDKTRYIKSILKDGNSVSLITRPRRFGKSLTQSMLKNFLELDYEKPGDTTKPHRLFSGFEILKDEVFCRENLGQWPVIFLSLKKVEGDDYATARRRLVSTVVDCAQSLDFLLESPKVKWSTKSNLTNLLSLKALPAEEQEDLVSDSLQMLVNALYEAYGRRVVVLVDEYDVPPNLRLLHRHAQPRTPDARQCAQRQPASQEGGRHRMPPNCQRKHFHGLQQLRLPLDRLNDTERRLRFYA